MTNTKEIKWVLVFGGSGFIGRAVILVLVERGYEVFNYDISGKENAPENVTHYTGSIVDGGGVAEIINHVRPDVIYNLAGLSHVETCVDSPLRAMKINILGQANILNTLWRITIHNNYVPLRFIYASSLYVYARGDHPYTISKQAAEALTRWYCKNKFFSPYVILRYGTIYGPGADDYNSIYKMVKNALDTGIISYYGTGEEVRQYIHIRDVARLSVDMLDGNYDNQEVVLTGAYPVKSSDMVYMLRDIMGPEYKVEFRNETTPDHYIVTPYAYQPNVAVTVPLGAAYDLAGGLLEVVREISGNRNVK